MSTLAIIYHSAHGHTEHIARLVRIGAMDVGGVDARLLKAEDIARTPDELVGYDGFIFGSPTYLGGVSAPFKGFMDSTGRLWRTQQLKGKLAAVMKTRTRDEWCALLEGSDACFAPVLSLAEAPKHPHNAARGTFIEIDGVVQPAPAPRFSLTPGAVQRPPAAPGENTADALADWGFAAGDIAALKKAGAIG